MGEDHLKINKFLELFPDSLVRSISYSLDRRMILYEHLESIEGYLSYVKNLDFSFENKDLKTSHSKFFEALSVLNNFIDINFSPGPNEVILILDPDIRKDFPEKWKELLGDFKILLGDMWNKYGIFRATAEKYLLGDGENSTKTPKGKNKKFPDLDEPLTIKRLGIRIEGKCVFFKNKEKKINSTDSALIKYLHYRFEDDERQCVGIDVLARDLMKTEEYLANRISAINIMIKDLILDGRKKTTLDDFIKNERGRGYHLNPRFVTQFTKKK
jgi:hypothetical protein